jgi:putative flippase GtrA
VKLPSWLHHSTVRFLLAGAANTITTLAIYVALLTVMPSAAAWFFAYLCGIAFVNIVYPLFVFRGPVTSRSVIGNSGYYMVVLALSEGALALVERGAGIDARIAGAVVAIGMIPINYLAARWFSSPPKS